MQQLKQPSESNLKDELNNEKQIRAQAQADLNDLRKTIEVGIMTKVENRMKDVTPGEGINTVPMELIKLLRREELKTIIIHRIFNTDPSFNIFELDPYNYKFHFIRKPPSCNFTYFIATNGQLRECCDWIDSSASVSTTGSP